eukprot:8570730-Ditylum_brightwellii.AAC.2
MLARRSSEVCFGSCSGLGDELGGGHGGATLSLDYSVLIKAKGRVGFVPWMEIGDRVKGMVEARASPLLFQVSKTAEKWVAEPPAYLLHPCAQ